MIKQLIKKIRKSWKKASVGDKIGGFLFVALIVYLLVCWLNINCHNIRLDGSSYTYPAWNFITWFLQ